MIETKVEWINLFQITPNNPLDLKLKKLQSFLIMNLAKRNSFQQEFIQWQTVGTQILLNLVKF